MKKTLWLLLGMVVILGLVMCGKREGAIEVKSTPEGASVYLDGDDTGEKTNTVLTEVESGDHTVKLTLEGYEDYETDVTVEAGDTVTVDATLKAAVGALQVNSTPTGAAIWLDGVDQGTVTNALLTDVPVGSHTLKLVLAGYAEYETSVTILKDDTVTVNAELTPTDVGSIQVNSTPSGAAIWLDGNNTGEVTPHLLEDIQSGNHLIKLTLAGYEDLDTTVTVNAGQTTTVDAVLKPAPPELIEDDSTLVAFGIQMFAGDRLAVKFTAPSRFELTEACYYPVGWGGDPDRWDEACDLVFFGPGAEPGTELGRKEVSASAAFTFNWFDISDLGITIESGDSFYFAVEYKVDYNPGLGLDGAKPLHNASWMYTEFLDEPGNPKWESFDNVEVEGEGWYLGDSLDLMLRVRGQTPGGALVTLTPDVRPRASHSDYKVTLPVDRKHEILDWRNLR